MAYYRAYGHALGLPYDDRKPGSDLHEEADLHLHLLCDEETGEGLLSIEILRLT